MMKRIAPAKVNLSLRILGKRDDGYHALRSLMVPLALADEITVVLTPGARAFSLTCSDASLPTDGSNLALRAAREFCASTGASLGGTIHIEKRIPHGAGLGGGSSDAAAVLRALATHTGFSDPDALESIAARIGSDVPFFIRCRPAEITGRGENVRSVPWERDLHLVLVKPPFAVSTPWAYAAWSQFRPHGESVELDGVEFANDLEPAVCEKFILLEVLRDWLTAQPTVRVARMSGSGSTMFAVTDGAADADALAASAREFFGPTFFIHASHTIRAVAE